MTKRTLTSEQQNAIQEAEHAMNEASAKAREKLASVGLRYPDDEPFAPCVVDGCSCDNFNASFSNPNKCRCGHHWTSHPRPQ